MDSALRPREIQSRIRAGQSLEEVARQSGESAERIQRFAAPVLAEREHVAGLALASSVRRRGDLAGHRSLRAVVRDQLLAHGVDPDTVGWDAWRNQDKRWTVLATWTQNGAERIARFQFDLVSRFSVADDAESRWLIAEDDASLEGDELALVRAVNDDPERAASSSRGRLGDPDEEPTISLADVPLRFAPQPPKFAPEPRRAPETRKLPEPRKASELRRAPESRKAPDPRKAPESRKAPEPRKSPEPSKAPTPRGNITPVGQDDWLPRSAATPQEIREEVEAEFDAYGVVPDGRSELDVLYDMLSGIAEDSINIYAGLSDPILSEPIGDLEPEPPVLDTSGPGTSEAKTAEPVPQALDLESQPTKLRPEPPRGPEPETPEPAATNPSGTDSPPPGSSGSTATSSPATIPASASDPGTDESTEPTRAMPITPRPTEPTPAAPTPTDATSDQTPVVDNEPTIRVAPGAAKRRGGRKKRASVPSWDEIMFGGPKLD